MFSLAVVVKQQNIIFRSMTMYNMNIITSFVFCSAVDFSCAFGMSVCVCAPRIFMFVDARCHLYITARYEFSQEHVHFSLSYVGYHKTLIVVSCIETNRNKYGTHRSSVQCPSPYVVPSSINITFCIAQFYRR